MNNLTASEALQRSSETNTPGRVLAIDLGERRMGLAWSDPLRLTAQGLPTIERRNRREDMNYLESLARKNNVTEIVVGDPINMDGTVGPQSVAATEFAVKLEKHLEIKVRLWDERLTSVEANRVLRDSGMRPKERAGSVDQVAAVLLLESFLESERPAQIPEGAANGTFDESIDGPTTGSGNK
jgi:putative Holliday junction resolvase